MLKSNLEGQLLQEFIVDENGVFGSEKNTDTEEIIIGRQQINGNNIRPNDIVLPAQDRAISRIHCKLNYKSCF